ncbi:AlkA N-terminal domain-containing protein [Luedemannella flava]|uniref:DNA-3-methyladenine glycosylase II n=1 Tax=Luedemannella flava TaxID=349316 RepID=A0ABP4YGK2_9ACTN
MGQLDFERCYRAVDSRDARFDGWFVTAVTSTKIYCRPSCPALTPKRANVRFLPSAAAAQKAGFRACLRCRPDAAPGSPEWDTRADLTGRAMRLIADGLVDREGVPGLAAKLGYTERHLHRMLTEQLGAGPLALARAQRAQTARILVETTDLGLAEIAFAAGFGSVRQFNDTMQEIYGRAPSRLRAGRRTTEAPTDQGRATINLRLAYRPPLDGTSLLEYLSARAIPGVEEGHPNGYVRALRLPHGSATASLQILDGYVQATLQLADIRDLAPAVARCRRLLDLDADPVAIDGLLAQDPALAPGVSKAPGVRVPRAVDGFEIAVRAIVGQQISVAGARTVLARLTAAAHAASVTADRDATDRATADGAVPARATPASRAELAAGLVPFPDASALLALADEAFGMPAARRRMLRALASAGVDEDLRLDPGADRAETEKTLLALPGIGPWTAQYVALRALGDPDVLLATDLGVRRGARAAGLPDDPTALARHAARRWAPWRSYATMRLWRLA